MYSLKLNSLDRSLKMHRLDRFLLQFIFYRILLVIEGKQKNYPGDPIVTFFIGHPGSYDAFRYNGAPNESSP